MTMQFSKEMWADPIFREKMKNRTYGNSMRGKTHSTETKLKIGISRKGKLTGSENPSWRGGRYIDQRGYVLVLKSKHPNAHKNTGYVYEHRLVMEKHLGRYLDAAEVVDHINGDKSDNRLSNLRVTDQKVNGFNRHGLNKNNSSGHRGIYYDKSRGKWCVSLIKNEKKHYIGRFDKLEDAIQVKERWLKSNA